jgi:tRNA(Ile)-lysidine synthase
MHLAGLARLAREEEVFWSALVEDRFRALVRADRGKPRLAIQARDLLLPLEVSSATEPAPLRALTERLIRRLYRDLHGDLHGLTAEHVERVIHLASESMSGRRIDLPGGILVERNFDELIFVRAGRSSHTRETAAQSNAYRYVVSLPGHGAATVSVPELKSRFCLKVIDWPIAERDTKRESAVLDADLLRAPLVLRNWRPGDAYQPRGRRQPQKLKEMFLAGRVPVRDRACWPVLESGGRVAWARGMPPAEAFCAREGTRAGVVIEEDHL